MDRNNVVPNSCEQSLCRQQRPPGYEVQASLTSAPFISLIRDPPRIHLAVPTPVAAPIGPYGGDSTQTYTPFNPHHSVPARHHTVPAFVELLCLPRIQIAQRLYNSKDGSGLWMRDALDKNYAGLRERDNRTPLGSNLRNCGAISIRIEWLGYPAYSKQVKTHDWCSNPQQIPLSKLGTEVAKVLQAFITDMRSIALDTSEPGYLEVGPVGSRNVNLENVFLVGLKHVSEASWQPEFSLFY